MRSGDLIKEARLLAGLSQKNLAERAGVPRPSIVRRERGTVEPGLETARRLLRICGFDHALVRYEPDESAEAGLSDRLELSRQERLLGMLDDPASRPDGAGATEPRFDPYAILAALDREGTAYVIVGAVARVLQGSEEITRGVDLTPLAREENLRRLDLALASIHAGRPDGREPAARTTDFAAEPVVELRSDRGAVKVVPFPEGTRGYDDLRRGAQRLQIGRGLRPAVASAPDLARMLHALGREQDIPKLQMMRRLIELDHGRSRGIER